MGGSAGGGAWHHRSPMEDQPIPLPGSDAERRAHLAVARRLRDGGRRVALETHWVRPRWELAHALHAGLGVAASVVAVGEPAVGLGLALLALLSLLLDLSGRAFLLRRLTPERATENVVAPDARGAAPPFRLLLVAHLDAPRGGLRHRLGRLPTGPPYLWLTLALLAVAGCAAARLAGDDGETLIGIVQLLPTLVLLVAVGLLVDSALAGPQSVAGADAAGARSRSEASSAPSGSAGANAQTGAPIAPAGSAVAAARSDQPSAPSGPAGAPIPPPGPAVAAVMSVARSLDAAPLPRVAVDVVIAGAGEGQAVGFLAHLRRHRRRYKAARDATAVVELTVADGPPRWWTGDAALLPLAYHPSLLTTAAAAADEERTLNAGPARRGRVIGAALRARQRRLPALRISAPDEASAVALLLAFAELLDAERG